MSKSPAEDGPKEKKPRRSRKKSPDISVQLRAAIVESGMPLIKLSQKSGVHSAQISRFLNQQRTLTLPAVVKICHVLRLTLVPFEG
ncbi:MAG: helix-turn-helix transcriptional regulator [Zavarzinella sp.]